MGLFRDGVGWGGMRVMWERCKGVTSGIRVDETERALMESWQRASTRIRSCVGRSRTRAWIDYIMRRYTVSSRAATALKVRVSGPRQAPRRERRC